MGAGLAAQQDSSLHSSFAHIAEVVVGIQWLEMQRRRKRVGPLCRLTDYQSLGKWLVGIDAEGATVVPEMAARRLRRDLHQGRHSSCRTP